MTFADIACIALCILFGGAFLYVLIRGFLDFSKKSIEPVVTLDAKVVSKRANEVRGKKKTTLVDCFVTFENKNGEQKELGLTPHEYQIINIGDFGTLTFKGNVLLNFEIKKNTLEEETSDE